MNVATGIRRPALCLVGAALLIFAASACLNPVDAGPKAKGKSAEKSGSDVVATVDGKPITRQELDQKALGKTLKQRQEIYDTEKKVIEEMVETYLLEKEAKKRGVTVEALVETEIEAKHTAVTDAEIESWYNQNKARVRNAPLEQVKGRIKPYLEQQKKEQTRAAFLDPLKEKADVTVNLDPPRVPVTVGRNPAKGPKGAPVTIVEFSDFQ
jgi:hypothetical protein